MLEGAGQELLREIDRQELGIGVDGFVAVQGGKEKKSASRTDYDGPPIPVLVPFVPIDAIHAGFFYSLVRWHAHETPSTA